MSESIHAFGKAQRRKVCLHPKASEGECNGGSVNAHTVPKALLRKIARDGQVYGFPIDYGAVVSSQGVLQPRLMGIGRASTFTGFCAKHDDQLFADIEKAPLQATERHACLVAYRALCRELFAKEGTLSLDSHLSTMDRGLNLPDQLAMQAQRIGLMTGGFTVLKEIVVRKKRYDQILIHGDYSTIKYCAIWLEKPPDVMCAGWKNPTWDFAGNRLQNLADLDTPAQAISLSLVSSDDRGCAFFSWLADEGRACTEFIGSLLNLHRNRIPDAIVRFVFSSFENQFWLPGWWEALSKSDQQALVQRLRDAVDPSISIPRSVLFEDDRRYVDWRVTVVESNVANLVD